MSMSTHVVGFKPADSKWKQMKAIWDACDKAKVSVPKEVLNFFEGVYPDDQPGMEVKINDAVVEYNAEARNGYDIDITKLPKDVKIVRVYNAW